MKRITLLDGSAGTVLWGLAEKAGIKREPVWKYAIEHPELVLTMHRQYVEAGSDMLQTDTFDANAPAVHRFSSYSVSDVVSAAVKLALEVAEPAGKEIYLSVGPLSELLEPYGDLEEEECRDVYAEMLAAGAAAGAKTVALETFMDVEMMRIAAEEAVKLGLKTICSMTFSGKRRTMMGNSVQQICQTLVPLGIAAIGMNCSSGPVEAMEVIREYSETTSLPLYFKPNSGMGETYSAAQFAEEIRPALEFVSYVGGCCGTDAEYVREIRKLL